MSTTHFPLLVPAVLCGFGIVLLGLATVLSLRKMSIYGSWTAAHGKLMDFKNESGRHGQVFAPIVSFRDSGGREITFTSRIASSRKRFNVGDDVPVLYNPLDSSKAVINRIMEMYLVEMILAFIGSSELAAGFVCWLLHWR